VRRAADRDAVAFDVGGTVTALAVLDDSGALLVGAYNEADDTTALVLVDAAGEARTVAEVGPIRSDPDSDGRVAVLALDDAHGLVWVAGGCGLVAFAPPPR
jgi:hypothetical protein